MTTFGTLFRDGNTWLMDAAPHVHRRMKRLFGRLQAERRGLLRFGMTPDIALDLAWVLERYPMAMSDADRAALETAAATQRARLVRLEQLLDPSYTPPTFALTQPPRTYQAREAAILLEKGGLLIGDDVGLGKTVAAIAAMTDPRALPAVVVCPTHLPRQWQREIATFAPDLVTHLVKKGTPYDLPREFGRQPDVLIVNYAKLSGWAKTLTEYAQYVVFDEVQELRHRGTARYEAAQTLAGAASYRLGLSATPIHNYGGEIFSILDLLQPECLGSSTEFTREWCGEVDARGRAKLRDPKAFGAWAREQFLLVRHTRHEVGRELPAVTRIPQLVDTDAAALHAVKATAADLAQTILATSAQPRGAKFEAAQELSVLLRQATGVAKAPYVADFVRLLVESGERVVLCGWHRQVYDIWLRKLADLRPRLYTGSESATEKDAAAAAFIAGETPVLVLSLRSGSGLNGLQAVSSCIVFGELDWSPAVHEQAIGRLARDGQESPVVAYFLTAEDGADPAIAEILGLKREQLDGIRNPTQDFLEQHDTTGDHVRRLAEQYLRQIGQPLPEPQAPAADVPQPMEAA
ncbi:DEAD/DEAH box helicase [Luteitalea sp.]